MGNALSKRLLTEKFESPAHEALLNLFVATNHLRDRTELYCREFDLTPPLYNVLRILRGGEPNGYSRGDISRRLIDRAPDVTRLLDRLESRGLVSRVRSEGDRRRSVNRITKKGTDLLDRMYPGIRAIHGSVAERLTEQECIELSRLCEKIYEDEE